MMTGSSLAIVSIELLTFVLTLKSLKLKCHVIDLEEADLSHIVLSHLVMLDIDISWVDPYETNSAYSTMSCPILTTLIFGDMSNEMVDNFIWIFQQSSQQLKCPALIHLKFKFTNCIEVSLEFIEILPTIMHLSFRSCHKSIQIRKVFLLGQSYKLS